jgi:hypothetical protein
MSRYLRHNEEVKEYFETRPGRLLVVNFENGDRWAPICHFLGHPIPSAPFPHENKSSAKRTLAEKVYFGLRDLAPVRARELVFNARMRLRSYRGLPDPRNRFNNFKENRAERQKWNDTHPRIVSKDDEVQQ